MPDDFLEPRLEHLYDMHIDLEAPQVIGQTPVGMRQIFINRAGQLTGPCGTGEVLAGGGDWAILRPDGVVQLDVRTTIKMDDGAMIYATYAGIISAPAPVFGRLLGGQDVRLDEYYFYTNPIFQTADERYLWLNQILAVGRGRLFPGGVEYRVWTLRNP